MSWYAILDFEGTIEKYNREELDRLNQDLVERKISFPVDKVEIDEEGNFHILADDYYAKFYDDDAFAKRLAEIVKKGEINLYFAGDLNFRWGYKIKDGIIKKLKSVWMEAE